MHKMGSDRGDESDDTDTEMTLNELRGDGDETRDEDERMQTTMGNNRRDADNETVDEDEDEEEKMQTTSSWPERDTDTKMTLDEKEEEEQKMQTTRDEGDKKMQEKPGTETDNELELKDDKDKPRDEDEKMETTDEDENMQTTTPEKQEIRQSTLDSFYLSYRKGRRQRVRKSRGKRGAATRGKKTPHSLSKQKKIKHYFKDKAASSRKEMDELCTMLVRLR